MNSSQNIYKKASKSNMIVMSTKANRQNVGNAGEFYIAYLLSARDCVVTVTLGRNEGFDLMVVNPKGNMLKISVKTSQTKTRTFLLNKKAENIKDPDLFYALTKITDIYNPEYWIVPSKVVADVLKSSHQIFLGMPGKGGKVHKDSTMRTFFLGDNQYCPNDWGNTVKIYERNIKLILEY